MGGKPVAQGRSELFRIGEVVKRTGFTRQQIHNFLTMGLISENDRTAGGHRLFSNEVFKRLSMIRGLLSQGYHLADIPRTFKGFLRVMLICACLGAGALAASSTARAAETRERLTAEDLSGIRKLFDGLREMMLSGDSSRVTGLFSPTISQQRLHEIQERLEAEFESRSYTAFSYSFDDRKDVDLSEPGKARVNVLIRYKYYERSQSAVPQGDDEGQFWGFDLVKSESGWRVADGRFFDTLYSTQDTILSRIFTMAAIFLIVGSFWGWMLLDCCFRSWGGRKLPWVLIVLLLPGVGALIYFFAVWMRQGPED